MRRGVAVVCLWIACAASAFGQVPAVSPFPRTYQQEEPAGPGEVHSGLAFLDSALPVSMMRFRFDVAKNNRRPTRAEYLFPADGFRQPERRLDATDMMAYAEYAFGPWFSVFAETPYRWLNPDFNENAHGVGDMLLGFKLITWQDTNFFATFQFKLALPSAEIDVLGTDHVTIEPGLLLHYRIAEGLALDGELRYSIPIGGTDYAGDVVRYGLGLTVGRRTAGAAWLTPVVEVNGWTALGGKTMSYDYPPALYIDSAYGDTIVNVSGGYRMGWNERMDIYLGYSRCVTGDAWYRDLVRLELRWQF